MSSHCPYELHVPPCPLCPPALPVFPCPSLGLPRVFPLIPCYLSQPGVPPCPHSVPSVPARAPRAPSAASAHLPVLPHTSQRGTRGETWQGTLKGTLPPPAAPVPAEEATVPGSPASSWKTGDIGIPRGSHKGSRTLWRDTGTTVGRHPLMRGTQVHGGGDTGTPMGTARAHRHTI